MADRTVNINIKYNVNAAEIQKAAAASAAAQKATEDLRRSVEQYGKATVAANRDVARSTKEASQSFNDLYSAIKLVLTGGIVKEMVGLTLTMAKLSGQVDGVKRAFDRLPNATLLLDNLQKSTHRTLTDLELMQKTLQASNFRIPLEKLGKLFEFAAAKAQQTGQEVNHLVDYIVSGIGYRSIKRLDDLGFTANRVKEALGGVSLQAASMGQVMDAVTKLMDEDLQRTGGYADTTATQVERIETKWASLKKTVSGILTSPAVLNFYEKVLTLLDRGANVVGGTATQNAAKERAIIEVQNAKERLVTKEIQKDKQKTFDVMQQEANTMQQNIGRNNDELKQAREKLDIITKIYTGEATRFDLYGDMFSLEGKSLNERRKINVAFSEQIRKDEEDLRKQIEYYNFRNLVLKESIKIIKEFNTALNQPVEDAEKEDVGKRSNVVADLRQVVDLDLKHPVTGEVGKYDKDNIIKAFTAMADLVAEGNIPPLKQPVEIVPMDDWDKIGMQWNEEWRNVLSQGIDDTNNFLISIEEAEVVSLQSRLNNVRNYYDEQQLLAGDNERAKKELRIKEERDVIALQKKIALAEWEAKRTSIILSTAGGIARAFIDYQWPYALIPAAAVAAQGGVQLAVANKNKPRFATGVIDLKGPGSETSDSIDAKLSRGESVMTAKQTREAFGILTDIRAGRLNDRIIKQIVSNGGSQSFNDERIVNAIKGQPRPPDLVRSGRQIYEVYTDQNANKRFIRSKSMG